MPEKTAAIDIVYWFYNKPAVTKNHLELLRKYNQNRRIFGLFGGDPSEAEQYKTLLDNELDDFWTYPGTYGKSEQSKWLHGDLLLLDWYEKRGQQIMQDSVAITQGADMLVFTDIAGLTPGIRADQVYFSGFRELTPELEQWYRWTRPDSPAHLTYNRFREFVAEKYGHTDRLKSCLYIYEVLNRQFFAKYLELDYPERALGMLEYKDPTLAAIHGIDIYERDLGVFWADPGQDIDAVPLTARRAPRSREYISTQLADPNGWRLFHPYPIEWDGPEPVPGQP